MRQLFPFLGLLLICTEALAADAPRVVFREPCDLAPVLYFWQGDKPTETAITLAKADPAPAEGAAYTKVTSTWPEGPSVYSYWVVNGFQPFELRKGVKYTFRGKVYCPGGQVQPKVRFDLPNAKVQPIWHAAMIVKGDGWLEFSIPDLRAIAEALSVKDKWDTDTVTLATIFFNVSGKPAVFAVDDLQVLAEGTPVPQYVREQKADFVVPADFPLLRIKATGDCSALKASTPGADGKDQPLFDGALYGEAAKAAGEHTFYVRPTAIPTAVSLSAPAGATCQVTDVCFILPDGSRVPPQPTSPGLGTPGPEGTAVRLGAIGPIPARKLPPTRVGVYFAPYAISDPGHLPSLAWLYTPRPETFAPFDFSVIQTQGTTPTREFCAKLKQLNPQHRVILRLVPIPGAVPKYAAEPFYRRGLIEHYADLINNAGPENVYAVSIGEEENGNLTTGLWWRDTPPDWIDAYRAPFERETGEKLTWVNAVCGNAAFLEWLKPKIRFYYNDIYTQLKARFPQIKVLQYIAIAHDGSDISWHEPGEILADGWVYWNFWFKQRLTLVDCALPGAGGAGETVPVTMWLDGTFQNMERVRKSGVPNDEIYHCGFAYQDEGKFYDVVEQIQMLRDLGYKNSFAFYATGAFLRPVDCNDPAKVGEIDKDPYKMWRQRLEKALAYEKQMAGE